MGLQRWLLIPPVCVLGEGWELCIAFQTVALLLWDRHSNASIELGFSFHFLNSQVGKRVCGGRVQDQAASLAPYRWKPSLWLNNLSCPTRGACGIPQDQRAVLELSGATKACSHLPEGIWTCCCFLGMKEEREKMRQKQSVSFPGRNLLAYA